MKRKLIFDRLLLVVTAVALLGMVSGFYIGLSKLGIQGKWADFIFFALTVLVASIYGIHIFLKEERIRRKRYIYYLIGLGFYIAFIMFMIGIDKIRLIPMEYLIGRAYRSWITGSIYGAILLFLLIYTVEKMSKR